MPTRSRALWVWFGLWLASLPISILWLDRPWADFAHAAHLRDWPVMVWLTHLADPWEGLALTTLLSLSILVALGYKRPWMAGPTRWSLAVLAAVAAKTNLKYLCGRTWPETWIGANPSWISDQVFTFDWLHGGQGWASFPSGHMTVTCAAMTAMAQRFPRYSRCIALIPLLVAAGLLASDYHWISDVIAGAGLGILCGISVDRLLLHKGR